MVVVSQDEAAVTLLAVRLVTACLPARPAFVEVASSRDRPSMGERKADA
jgi:hypothetical protein